MTTATTSPRQLTCLNVPVDSPGNSFSRVECLQISLRSGEYSCCGCCWCVFALTMGAVRSILNYGKIDTDHLCIPLLAGTIVGKIARTCPDVLFGSC